MMSTMGVPTNVLIQESNRHKGKQKTKPYPLTREKENFTLAVQSNERERVVVGT